MERLTSYVRIYNELLATFSETVYRVSARRARKSHEAQCASGTGSVADVVPTVPPVGPNQRFVTSRGRIHESPVLARTRRFRRHQPLGPSARDQQCCQRKPVMRRAQHTRRAWITQGVRLSPARPSLPSRLACLQGGVRDLLRPSYKESR